MVGPRETRAPTRRHRRPPRTLVEEARPRHALAAHGLFVGEADQALKDEQIAKPFITDTVPPFRLQDDTIREHLEIVSAAPLFADAIRCLNENRSINDLLEPDGG